jgi:hypothetical protein
MLKSDLIKKLNEIDGDEEIYILADGEDDFDLARMKPAHFLHSVSAIESEGGEMVELSDDVEYAPDDPAVKSIFLIY